MNCDASTIFTADTRRLASPPAKSPAPHDAADASPAKIAHSPIESTSLVCPVIIPDSSDSMKLARPLLLTSFFH
jgi:hypothetical protein